MYGTLQVALALSVAWIQDAAADPAATDSGVLMGWFNSHTYIGAPPMYFIGIFIEGPSRIGHYVRPAYADAHNQREVAGEGSVLRPDGRPHDWTLRYVSGEGDDSGTITVTLDDESVSTKVPAEVVRRNAAFDRFGVVMWNTGGHFVEVYFDDLEFTGTPRKVG